MTSHAQPVTARPPDQRTAPDHTRRLFLLARAQLAAGRTELLRGDAAMRRWNLHHRRFS